jgi:hypothetical protein
MDSIPLKVEGNRMCARNRLEVCDQDLVGDSPIVWRRVGTHDIFGSP